MYKRTCEIIRIIYKRPNKFDIKGLAQLLSVSIKTVQADIHEINEYFESKEIASFEIVDNKFSIKKTNKAIYEILNTLSFYDYKLSKEERLVIEALLLIFTSEHVTLSNIAEFMYVSRSTVIGDLKYLNDYLNDFGLSTNTQLNMGICINGPEINVRNLFVSILLKYGYLYSLFSHQEGTENLNGEETKANAREKNIILQNLTSEVEGYSELHLTECSFNMLVNYFGMAIFRMKSGKHLKNYEQKSIDANKKLIERLFKLVCQHFNLVYNENELEYLKNFSVNLTYLKKNNCIDGSKEIVKIQTITRLFIMNVSKSLNRPLYRDYELFQSLSNHLERIFNDGFINSAEYDEINVILEKYDDIKKGVTENIEIIEQYVDRIITDEEISYIVVYICASLEKMKIQTTMCNVILICNSGIGTSQLLKSKLLKRFDFNIINVIPKHRLGDLLSSEVNFIISTVDLEDVDVPYIKISPQFTDSDFLRMRKMIDDYGCINSVKFDKNEYSDIISKIKPIVKNDDELLDVFKESLNNYFAKKNKVVLSLSNLLTEEFIQVDVEADTWQQAIEKASENLLEKGYINNNYIKSMIKNVEQNGPYFVISEGFAIPHSVIDEGSRRLGFNLIRLKNPVVFNAGIYDPIKYLCVINAVDNEKHLKALFNLVNLLQIYEFKEALNKAENSKDVAKIIEVFERRIQ
ncbi:BglG family transcription antiterminator [Clostridium arbusti]|uniref:BglG family transcription antiterminator n=1 Tax=Clostridium arbusti TaxID=1137848 RepID=UPI000289113A|nr:PTS sugar transporter subunit IIA [Clostridium arbusti]